MSVNWVVPRQARFIQTANVFAATFNVPTLGSYDFNVPANQDVVILALQPNTVYLVERVTTGADISEADYAAALDLANGAPTLSVKRGLDSVTVWQTAMPMLRFIEQQESSAWVKSDNSGDTLTASVTGGLLQTAALVGVATIRLSVVFSIYAMDSTIYNRSFRAGQSMGLGEAVRGG